MEQGIGCGWWCGRTIAAANEVPLLTASPGDEGPLAQTTLSPGAQTISDGVAAPCENRAMAPFVVVAPATIKGKLGSKAQIAGTVLSAGEWAPLLPDAVTTTTS